MSHDAGLAGRTLSHYRVVELLGAGGMGEVYRAHDEKLDRDVALKVLPEGALADESARARFRKEAHALSRLSHPHIAHLLDFDSEDGVDFLVLELITGPSLSERLRDGPLPEKDVLRLGAQLARGLQAAHDHGIVHRDLKPSNLHLTPDGLLKILDFGLARLLRPETGGTATDTATETAAGAIVGSPPYMAPEQLLGKPPDARTDVYAAGAVLYEMATGRRPFGTRNGVALSDAILHVPPPPPRSISPELSPALESVILKALDKDPELRYQTAKDLLVDLERLQLRPDSRPSSGAPTARLASGLAPSPGVGSGLVFSRRRPWRRGLGLVAAAAVVAAGTIAVWVSRSTRVPRITAVHALATLISPSQAWNRLKYVATDGEQLYYVTVKGGRNILGHVPLTGGDPDEEPLPFPGVVLLLSAMPGESAVIVAGSLEGSVLPGADEGWPLWRVSVGGGAPQRLGDLLAYDADVSPDGRSLALTRGKSLLLSTIDGAHPRELHRLANRAWGLKWAPDGSRLRFTSGAPGDTDSRVGWRDTQESWIWEASVTGGTPRALWPGYAGDWTADGRYYVFTRGPALNDVYLRGPADNLLVATESWRTRWWATVPQPLTSGALKHVFVGSSRDGRRLVAFLFPPDSGRGGSLMRYDRARQAFEPALGGESAIYAEPSPDGAWIAWVRYPEGSLWRSRPDGSDRLQLTSPPAVAHLPRWSPDGRRIVFSSQPDPSRFRKELRVVAADGTMTETVAQPSDPGAAYWDPCWLPDGSILFGRALISRPGLLRYDPATRNVEPLAGAETLGYPKCSPRGDVLASGLLASGGTHWMVRHWASDEWRDLGSYAHVYPNWTRDGRSVCALTLSGDRIECMDIDEGRMRTLADTSALHLAVWVIVPWMGLDAEDRPLVTVTSSQAPTVYALDWDAP